MKKELTSAELKKMDACSDGAKWYRDQKTTDIPTLAKAAISGGMSTMNYANWGLVRLMSHKQKVQYAVFAARSVLPIFEAKFPEDKRPRMAIEASEKWAENPTEGNRKAADAAAYAADAAYAAYAAAAAHAAAAADATAAAAHAAAAYAADAAAYAAAAAADAAYAAYAAAAYAADAAADAAAYAAHAAARARARARLTAKIIRYGVKLVMGN